MQILWDNLIDNSSVFSGSAPVSGWSTDALYNYHLSKYCRYLSPTITIDLGYTRTMAMFALVLASGTGSSFTIKGSLTTSFTSPLWTQTCNSYYSNGDKKWYLKDLTGLTSCRYIQLNMATFSGYVDISYLHITKENSKLQMPPLDPSIELTYNNTGTVSRSITGQTYGNAGINYFSSGFEFPIITDYARTLNGKTLSTREEILTFWFINQGIKPFILLPFENSLDHIPPLMAIIDDNSLSFAFDRTQGHYKLKFKITETK